MSGFSVLRDGGGSSPSEAVEVETFNLANDILADQLPNAIMKRQNPTSQRTTTPNDPQPKPLTSMQTKNRFGIFRRRVIVMPSTLPVIVDGVVLYVRSRLDCASCLDKTAGSYTLLNMPEKETYE
ncbi:MAG: hypothetical protein GY947_09495 [Rhodobacteraceae bacterium]|nr:hypothetical protein [Paracoccaceae bacterium]